MFGMSNHDETPVLRTYAQALAYYEAGVPIQGKGKNAGRVPLGGRAYVSKRYMAKDEGTGKISCVLYQTPVLTFHTDDTIEINPNGWLSRSTAQLIEAVLNTHISIQSKELLMVHFHGNMHEPQTHVIQDGMKIRYTTDQYGQTDSIVQGSKPCYRYKLNRKRWKEVKQMFAPFREYMALVSATQPEFIEISTRNARRYLDAGRTDDIHAFFMDVAQAQKGNNYEAMLPLIKEMAEFCCPNHWRRLDPTDCLKYEVRTTLIKKKLIQHFDGLLKYEFANDIFIREMLPDGKYIRDSKAIYVKRAVEDEVLAQLKAVI